MKSHVADTFVERKKKAFRRSSDIREKHDCSFFQDYDDEIENGRGRRHSSPGGSRGNPRDYGHHLHPDNLVSPPAQTRSSNVTLRNILCTLPFAIKKFRSCAGKQEFANVVRLFKYIYNLLYCNIFVFKINTNFLNKNWNLIYAQIRI